jgi:nicotinamide mononucleotide transporter
MKGPWLEIAANAMNAISIVLAARNSIHTWWIGIVGCVLFGTLFFLNQLYADELLQVFFVATSCYGWWHWLERKDGQVLPVTRAAPTVLGVSLLAAVVVAVGYGYALKRYTNAFAPFADSLILALSVLAQLLLMGRRYDAWWVWLAVNTLSVVLFTARGLYITAALYACFWVIAVVALFRWRRMVVRR